MNLSLVICTHNPDMEVFEQTMDHIKKQDFCNQDWELILVDNASNKPLQEDVRVDWHPNYRIVNEEKLGLSNARLAGVSKAKSNLIVFVDDDNLLKCDFLSKAYQFYIEHPQVGTFGGKAIPKFETDPPDWFFKTGISLGCRDLGDNILISDFSTNNFLVKQYPKFAPIGTGMVITKEAFLKYTNEVHHNQARLDLGRKGNALTSGEDNDIVLTVIKNGYEIAYVPSLVITHLIPEKRYGLPYLKKMAFEVNRSWVKVLDLHNICPWKPVSKLSLPFRKLRAYIANRAWVSPLNYIRFQVASGMFKGLSEINTLPRK